MEDIVVTVTKSNGEPVANQPVQIEAVWISGSGGHSHTNAPSQDQMGVLSVLLPVPLAPEQGRGVIEAETDEEGKIYLNYTTPQFGGTIDLVATLQTTTGQSDSKRVTVRVPGLVLLPDNNLYEKIGGTPNHHGPRLDVSNEPYLTPDDNHWVDENVVIPLVNLALLYSIQYPDAPVIRYNDISLPNGGLFDINGNWTSPHSLHQIGQNVDIRTSPPRSDGIPLALKRRIEEILVDLYPYTTVEEHGSKYISRETGNEVDSRHFHIDFEIFN